MTQKLKKEHVLYFLHRRQEQCRIPLRVETEDGFYTRTASVIDDVLGQLKFEPYISSFTHEFTGGHLVINATFIRVVTEEFRDEHMDALYLIIQDHHDEGFNRTDAHDLLHLEMELDQFNAELESIQNDEFQKAWRAIKVVLLERLTRAFEIDGVTFPNLQHAVRFNKKVMTSETFTLDEILAFDDLP